MKKDDGIRKLNEYIEEAREKEREKSRGGGSLAQANTGPGYPLRLAAMNKPTTNNAFPKQINGTENTNQTETKKEDEEKADENEEEKPSVGVDIMKQKQGLLFAIEQSKRKVLVLQHLLEKIKVN